MVLESFTFSSCFEVIYNAHHDHIPQHYGDNRLELFHTKGMEVLKPWKNMAAEGIPSQDQKKPNVMTHDVHKYSLAKLGDPEKVCGYLLGSCEEMRRKEHGEQRGAELGGGLQIVLHR